MKVGFIGAGFMSRTHANNMLKMDSVEVVAVCGNKGSESTQRFAEEFACMVFDDYVEMFDTVEMDAVVIAIPPAAHCGQAEYAAQKKIAIFMEKPIALDVKRADSIGVEIKKNGVISMVGYHMRFGVAVQKLNELLTSGKAGKITMVDATYRANSLHSEWWRDVNQSGGQVFEQAIHLYDLVHYFLGKPISISGYTKNICHKDEPTYSVEDTAASVMLFENGAIGSVTSSNCAVPMKWEGSFSVICEKVTAIFTDHNNAEFIYTDTKDGEEPKHETIKSDKDPYYAEINEFCNCVKSNCETTIPVSDGLVSLHMVDSCVKSNGKMIEL